MVDKKKAFVQNKFKISRVKRFFAICKGLGLGAESQKSYYKRQMDVLHMDDLTDDQWDYIFEDLAGMIEEQAKRDGVIFTRNLDETIAEILAD